MLWLWLHQAHSNLHGEAAPPNWAGQVAGMAMYDSMAFFTRGPRIRALTRLQRGDDVIAYGPGDRATRHDPGMRVTHP